MKKIFLPALVAATFFTACHKDDNDNSTADFNATKDAAIADFVNKVSLPVYADMKAKATALDNAVSTLNSSTTDPNLEAARNAWRDLRATWEKSEAFLFGPVDEHEYDPDTDTWPVNFNDMNALLADVSHDLSINDVRSLGRDLKGYHPLEYVLWGTTGTKAASDLTPREKTYMVSLATFLKETADKLYDDWQSGGGNYANDFLTAGTGSTVFVKKQDAFLQVVDAMTGICGEVGEGKMLEPFDTAAIDPVRGAQLVESPFSGNSVTDFKNNITGAYNVYLGKFTADGTGLEDLVKAKNSALDVELQQKFNAAIESFNNITYPYGVAISSQPNQCLATMNAINALADALENKLRPFIIQYITD